MLVMLIDNQPGLGHIKTIYINTNQLEMSHSLNFHHVPKNIQQ